ncbi:MAG: hypothetical protein OEL53_05135 [Rhodospirillales bacterium]|nr:hypothetical protein [Rhodospirillales bacterium]
MNFLTVTVIIFIVALIGVFAVALIVYLSSLVKSAYQIKIEMRNDLEEGLKRADEELNKRSRWIKRELLDEIEKIKGGLQADITNRGVTILDESHKQIAGVEEGLRKDLAETNRLLGEARDLLYALDHRVKSIRREVPGQGGPEAQAKAAEGASPASTPALPPPSAAPAAMPLAPSPAVTVKTPPVPGQVT